MKSLSFYFAPVAKDQMCMGDYCPVFQPGKNILLGWVRVQMVPGDENEAVAGADPRNGETFLNAVQYEP